MTFYAIMLTSEITTSPYTHPIAEESSNLAVLENLSSLNNRARRRVSKDEFKTQQEGSSKIYDIVGESQQEEGAIYKITNLSD
jgi:hypothetical protein